MEEELFLINLYWLIFNPSVPSALPQLYGLLQATAGTGRSTRTIQDLSGQGMKSFIQVGPLGATRNMDRSGNYINTDVQLGS